MRVKKLYGSLSKVVAPSNVSAELLIASPDLRKENKLVNGSYGMQIFAGMVRSFAFTTQGRLQTKDIDMFLMPTLLADTNLFPWVDL